MRTIYSFSNFGLKAAAGVLAIAATFGTVATVQAKEPAGFKTAVEASIDNQMRMPSLVTKERHGIATVAVLIDGNGEVLSTRVIRSSGHGSFDREALRTARTVSYPATGEDQTVAMVLGFNQKVKPQDRAAGREVVAAWAKEQRVMMANKNATAQPDS